MSRIAVVRVHSGDLAGTPVPAQTIAGIHAFLILGFSGSIKHLGAYPIMPIYKENLAFVVND
jgi:hypothetical protein